MDEPHWEVYKARDPKTDAIIGYRVRWSRSDAKGKYLYVRHYVTNESPIEPPIGWCEEAAYEDCERMNREGRRPETINPSFVPKD